MGLGRLDEALEHNRAARRLDPLSLPANANLGIIPRQAGDYSGARRELQRTLALAPNFPLTLYYLGVVHAAERSYDEATAALERAAGEAPAFPGVKAALAYSYSRLGRQREADGIVEDLRRTGTDARQAEPRTCARDAGGDGQCVHIARSSPVGLTRDDRASSRSAASAPPHGPALRCALAGPRAEIMKPGGEFFVWVCHRRTTCHLASP
ncbi:MAG: hypothetical protein K0S86_3237 [Geminicoccaceae bacterium]|nr:hypothetical protein [Geminicoccaceae bacterium]